MKNKKADVMWMFNALAATGIIALLFLGLFLLLKFSATENIQKIQTDLEHLDSSGQIITILRAPSGDITIADAVAKGDVSEFTKSLETIFGEDVKYRIWINNELKRDTTPRKVIAKVETALPMYPTGTQQVRIEVGT